MRAILIACSLVSSVFLVTCARKNPGRQTKRTKPAQTPKPLPRAVLKKRAQSFNQIGWRLMRALVKEKPQRNIVFSPFALGISLSATYAGANGQTAREFEKLLNIQKQSPSIHAQVGGLQRHLTNRALGVRIRLAQALFSTHTCRLKSTYKKTLKNDYGARIMLVDFSRPKKVVSAVNGFASKATGGLIPYPLDPRDVTSETMSAYVVAALFEGHWRYRFLSKNTRPGFFAVHPKRVVKIPFMRRTITIHTAGTETASAFALPYKDKNFTLWILMPVEKKSLADVWAEMTPRKVLKLAQNTEKSTVRLDFPKLSVRFRQKWKGVLQKEGLSSAFSASADFSKLGNCGRWFVDDYIQETVVRFSEKGTRAATVVVRSDAMCAGCGPDEMRVDRPFIFFIVEKTTQSIVFWGQVTDPKPRSAAVPQKDLPSRLKPRGKNGRPNALDGLFR